MYNLKANYSVLISQDKVYERPLLRFRDIHTVVGLPTSFHDNILSDSSHGSVPSILSANLTDPSNSPHSGPLSTSLTTDVDEDEGILWDMDIDDTQEYTKATSAGEFTMNTRLEVHDFDLHNPALQDILSTQPVDGSILSGA